MCAQLYRACEAGDLQTVGRLLDDGQRSDLAPAGVQGWTPLHVAAQKGDVHLLRLLLRAPGAGPNVTNERGWAPTHLAAQLGHTEVLHVLQQHGASTACRTTAGGNTPLHVAAQFGQAGAVEVLLRGSGASVNALNSDGWTPLDLAAYKGFSEAVGVLLAGGADVAAASSAGNRNTALHWAVAGWKAERAARVSETVAALTAAGADPFAANDSGVTPAGLAAEIGVLQQFEAAVAAGREAKAAAGTARGSTWPAPAAATGPKRPTIIIKPRPPLQGRNKVAVENHSGQDLMLWVERYRPLRELQQVGANLDLGFLEVGVGAEWEFKLQQGKVQQVVLLATGSRRLVFDLGRRADGASITAALNSDHAQRFCVDMHVKCGKMLLVGNVLVGPGQQPFL